MKTQRRKRSRRINKGNLAILMVIAVAALALIAAGGAWLLSNREPAFMKSKTASSEVLKDKSKDVLLAVYYPQSEDSTFLAALSQNAENIFNDLKTQTDGYQKEKKPLMIKADYQMNVTQDRYVSLEYTIARNENETVEERQQAYFYDLAEHQWIEASSLLDEAALKWLAANLRVQLKNDENTQAAAYTLPVIEATAWDSGNYSNFTLKDGMLIFNFPAGMVSEKAYRWEFPISNLGEHFLLDVGQGRLPENNVRIAPRLIDPDKPMVALTFDDGPHPTNTPQLLNLLQHYDGAATFFMQGMRVEKYPETTLMVINSASEAASHSYNHPKLTKLKGDNLLFQLNRTTELVQELTGWQVTIKHFRPPYGASNALVKENSAYPLILWGIDTMDWKTLDPVQTVDNTMASVKDGAIVLMHDIHAETVTAVEALLPKLIEAGYQLVSVDEMLNAKGVEAYNGQRVYSAYDIKD